MRSRILPVAAILIAVAALLWAVSNGSRALMAKTLNPDGSPMAPTAQSLPASATHTSMITEATQLLGSALYRYGSLPFEIASVLLLVAIIGSVMLARTLKQEASAEDLAPEVLREEILKDPELANLEQLTIE